MGLSGEPLVILGSFRSGTSCLATAVAELGVYQGAAEDFEPEDEYNKGGYWELSDMQMLNAKCLATFGMTYFQSERLPQDWLERPGSAQLVSEIRATLRKHFDGQNQWGFKEPSTTVLMPLYEEAFRAEGVDAPTFPIMVRHPLSVVASQKSRQSSFGYTAGLSSPQGHLQPLGERTMGIWVHYTLSALKETKGKQRLVIPYENFLQDPTPYLHAMADRLLVMKPTEEQIAGAAATVNPSWSHSKHSVEELHGWPHIVSRTYDCALRADRDPDGLNAGAFDAEVDALWSEWLLMSDMARPIPLPTAQMFVAWQGPKEVERVTKKYSPTDSWQCIRVEVPAPPRANIQVDLHQLPCQIWVRKAVWHVDGKEVPIAVKGGPNGIVEDLGTLRLTSFGPGAMFIQAPAASPAELELEIMVMTDQAAMLNVVGMMRAWVDQARRGGPVQRR